MRRLKIELQYEPEHFNPRCNCSIPASWTAFFSNGQPKWPCGDTREEAESNIRREYPNAKVI